MSQISTTLKEMIQQQLLTLHTCLVCEVLEITSTDADGRACDICASLDGQRFKIADRSPGVNFPPMHPWCRCTFVPVYGGSDSEKRAYFEKGSSGELTDSAESGIITSNGIEITSMSDHLQERLAERNILQDSVKDALINPLHITEAKYDSGGRPSQQFIGKGATVAINPETGIVVTAWATSAKKREKYSGGDANE